MDKQEILDKITKLASLSQLNDLRLKLFGKEGEITKQLKTIPTLSPQERGVAGKELNLLKAEAEQALTNKEQELRDQSSRSVANEQLDVTLPGTRPQGSGGSLHPITQMREKAEVIFERMGFEIIEPRELDDDYHVFESLNIPPQHPARDLWDTFWTEEGYIPITHTSSMQNRVMQMRKPPIRAIIPGRCFRHEATDARHEHTFYQIEGVYVDKGITLTDLIGTLKTFMEAFYEHEVKYRIHPTYFPFVEPGLEFLIQCVICQGKGCPTCGQSGWLELVPCGPIHPKVLTMAGLDSEKYSGFAWGLGLDRLVMIKYGIEDIRHFHSGDLRFLKQF